MGLDQRYYIVVIFNPSLVVYCELAFALFRSIVDNVWTEKFEVCITKIDNRHNGVS